MGRRARHKIGREPSALDAVLIGQLPRAHQVASIASSILERDIWSTEIDSIAARLIAMVTDSEEESITMSAAIMLQMKRQRLKKVQRISSRYARQRTIVGRINDVCRRIFGDHRQWSGQLPSSIQKPNFRTFIRDGDTFVASLYEMSGTSSVYFGIVYRRVTEDKTFYVSTPLMPRNKYEFPALLGLPPQLVRSNDVKIDWSRRQFIVNGVDRIPWSSR